MNGPRDGAPGGIEARLAHVRSTIARAAGRAGRDPDEVTLVAVGKTVAVEVLAEAVSAGVDHIGENRVQELRAKAPSLPDVTWHFIGNLQASGAHHIAEHADVIHSVTGGRATERLARRAADAGRVLDALIEIDLTGAREGVDPRAVSEVIDRVALLDGLRLRGLMTIPSMPTVAEDSRSSFIQLRRLRDRIREKHPDVLALSMGMSLDYEVAVEEGATMVRVGTALFGPRPQRR